MMLIIYDIIAFFLILRDGFATFSITFCQECLCQNSCNLLSASKYFYLAYTHPLSKINLPRTKETRAVSPIYINTLETRT